MIVFSDLFRSYVLSPKTNAIITYFFLSKQLNMKEWYKLHYKLNKNEEAICSLCTVAEADPTHIITRTFSGSYNLYSVGDDLTLSKISSGKSPLDYYNIVFGIKKSILKHSINTVNESPTMNELKEVTVTAAVKTKVDATSKVKAKPKSNLKDSTSVKVKSTLKSKSIGRTSFL